MKRRELLRHLLASGCVVLREGGRHAILHNPKTNATSSLPRHGEINDFLARKICCDLGVDIPH
jgi:predicted RNA binding protein YcfA (HicA-like mRNA interferase family)